ncbi:phosphatidylinositol mannoside acyltransferase [Nocardiopsis gilva YIM 90087]|uniref:Phosphatidylinositol mannoside acyltransferase n=1 Tax=Nocardiopsis gilva YIM 90087 TaxID=1235441 RepID=A0A223S979_9ACTN|nr:phosphatidylinositol mannoside acyltransferase [Nocardiopsis gilva]ASU84663.1 phosphatidylinositol mannoside acyltransferase [Nocardiopsis gilva YIM 90087]
MDERTSAAAFTAAWALIRKVPEGAGRHVFDRIADRAWRKRVAGVQQLEANLRRVAGPYITLSQLRALSRATMRSYMRYYYEMFRLPAMPREQVMGRVHVTGIEKVEENLGRGRGVVGALPHMANYDLAGAWIAMYGIRPTTVAQRVRPERLFQRFMAFRASIGIEVLPLTGGDGDTFGTLARRLRDGRLVCLLADRDLTRNGVEVDFFGEPARMPVGPAALAERTGAALLPVSLWYEDDAMLIHIHDEIPQPVEGNRESKVRALTQRLAEEFEGAIAEHPENWHMLQRVFTADLSGAHPIPFDSPDTGPAAGRAGLSGTTVEAAPDVSADPAPPRDDDVGRRR